MRKFFEDTMQGLLEAVAIEKGETDIEEKTDTFSFKEWAFIEVGKILLIGTMILFLYLFRYPILEEIIVIDSKIMYSLAFL